MSLSHSVIVRAGPFSGKRLGLEILRLIQLKQTAGSYKSAKSWLCLQAQDEQGVCKAHEISQAAADGATQTRGDVLPHIVLDRCQSLINIKLRHRVQRLNYGCNQESGFLLQIGSQQTCPAEVPDL